MMLCDAVQALGGVEFRKARPDRRIRAQDPRSQGHWRAVDARRAGAGAVHSWRRPGAGHALGHAFAGAVRGFRRCGQAGRRACRPATMITSSGCGHAAIARTGAGLDDQRQHRPSLSRQSQHPPRRDRCGAAAGGPARHRVLAWIALAPAGRAGRAMSFARSGSIIAKRVHPSGWASAATRRSRSWLGVRANRRRGQGAGASRRVTLVRFFRADGTLDKEVEAEPGQRLLDVAWAAREPLEGACEGVMACSTCHVIVEAEDFEKCPRRPKRKRTCSTSRRMPRGLHA